MVPPPQPPPRLGDLVEAQLWLRVDCRRCGHSRLLRPGDLFGRASPATPWRWLRFRCGKCRSRAAAATAGPRARIAEGPPPLHRRADLVALIARALRLQMSHLDEGEARAAAETVLRRMMAAGLEVSGPEIEGA